MTQRPSLLSFVAVEVEAMLAASLGTWWRAFILAGTECGLRAREALWLAWGDIDVQSLAISVTWTPVETAGGDEINRPAFPCRRERVIPMTPSLSDALLAHRRENPSAELVFIPDWKLDQLWPEMLAGRAPPTERIAPGIHEHFRRLQRFAHLELARRLGVPLRDVRWDVRPLSALRNTFGVHAARAFGVREAATQFECRHASRRRDAGLDGMPERAR